MEKLFKHKEQAIFFITLAVHLLVVVVFAIFFGGVFGGSSDGLLYHEHASTITSLIEQGQYTLGAVYNEHWYPIFISLFYFMFGKFMVVGMIANAVLMSFVAVLIFRIMKMLDAVSHNDWYSFAGALVVSNLYPSLLMNSSLLLKDAWICALVVFIIYLSLLLIRSITFKAHLFIPLIISFVLLRDLRAFVAVGVSVGFFIAWFLLSKISLRKRIIMGGGMMMVFFLISSIFTGSGLLKSPPVSQYTNLSYIHDIRSSYFRDGATTKHLKIVTLNQNGNRVISIKNFTKSFISTAFGPFPWEIPSEKYRLGFFENMWAFLIMLSALVVIINTAIKRYMWLICIAGLLFIGVIMGSDNVGATLRYRLPALLTLSLLLPIGSFYIIRWLQGFRKSIFLFFANKSQKEDI